VTGWSTRDLAWSGVGFSDFYQQVLLPALKTDAEISHVMFIGTDGYHSILLFEDAMRDDVMLAHRLDGEALDVTTGGPLRLVSPQQYAYKSAKHLTEIRLCTSEPMLRPPDWYRRVASRIVAPHPRARVMLEERHRHVPAWLVRYPYRSMIAVAAKFGRRQLQRLKPTRRDQSSFSAAPGT